MGWILGIRPGHAGLRIDPCIPAKWEGCSARRRFRGRTLNITVHKPRYVPKGMVEMKVDGEIIPGNP
jgi:cellobiose phosphorylase